MSHWFEVIVIQSLTTALLDDFCSFSYRGIWRSSNSAGALNQLYRRSKSLQDAVKNRID